MLAYAAVICCLLSAVMASDTARIVHSPGPKVMARQFQPDQVLNTTWPITMWFDAEPTYWDVIQRKVYDCWLAATTISVVTAQPKWLTHLLFTEDGQSIFGLTDPLINRGIIQLWNMNSNLQHNFSVSAAMQSRTEDRPGERWWNSAVMQGLMTLSEMTEVPGVKDGTFNEVGGDPGAALFALTGHSAVMKEKKWYGGFKPNATKLYDDMVSAYYNRSPMVITTYDGSTDENGLMQNSILYGYHAYGFMWPKRYENGTMTAMLRNPWGKSQEVELGEIIINMSWLYHLHDFVSLNWTAATNGEQPYWGINLPQKVENPAKDVVKPLDALQAEAKPVLWTATATLSDRTTTYQRATARYSMTYTPKETSTEEAQVTSTSPTAVAGPATGTLAFGGVLGGGGQVRPTEQSGVGALAQLEGEGAAMNGAGQQAVSGGVQSSRVQQGPQTSQQVSSTQPSRVQVHSIQTASASISTQQTGGASGVMANERPLEQGTGAAGPGATVGVSATVSNGGATPGVADPASLPDMDGGLMAFEMEESAQGEHNGSQHNAAEPVIVGDLAESTLVTATPSVDTAQGDGQPYSASPIAADSTPELVTPAHGFRSGRRLGSDGIVTRIATETTIISSERPIVAVRGVEPSLDSKSRRGRDRLSDVLFD